MKGFWFRLILVLYVFGRSGTALAAYSCNIPLPDPTALTWKPYKYYCTADGYNGDVQNKQIDAYWDYYNDCARRATETERARRQASHPDCTINVETSGAIIIDVPLACVNGNTYVGFYYEQFSHAVDVICPGEPTWSFIDDLDAVNVIHEPVAPGESVPERNLGSPECGISVGNPINAATGNKYQRETDAVLTGKLEIQRHYNSLDTTLGPFGRGWHGSYERRIDISPTLDPGNDFFTLIRDDGEERYWRYRGGVLYSSPDRTGQLTIRRDINQNIISLEYLNEANETEFYDGEGRLQTVVFTDGDEIGLEYTSGKISRITNKNGYFIDYQYSVNNGLVEQITSSNSEVWGYAYDAILNLAAVTFPDGNTRTYHYENLNFPQVLTGIGDASGQRIRTWDYDPQGRAILVAYGDAQSPIGRHQLNFNTDGTTSVVEPLSNQRNIGFQTLHGVSKFGSVDSACAGCGTKTAVTSYDARGNPDQVTDRNGNTSDHDYDDRNLLTRRVSAQGTAEEQVIQYQWHPVFRKITQIDEAGQSQSYTYNSRGQIMTHTITDTVSTRSKTWAYTYHEAPAIPELIGKLQSLDGPRTDVADVTYYGYYTTDDPGGMFRNGDLHTTTNALGFVTEYLQYDGNGRPLQTSDANDVMTTIDYHPRGWTSSRTTAGQTTSFSYDNTGNLTRVTQPDGSFTENEYDAAQRLVAIEDNFNNRVEYTLDAAGNRIAESTYNDLGVLRRQLSRVYDQLGRLQTAIDGNQDEIFYAYDGNGNRTSIQDPNLNTTAYEYDPLDRLARTIDAALNETRLGYDDRGNLTSVIDPLGNTSSYSYDGMNNQIRLDSPDTGITAWEYDDASNRTASTDARGVRVDYGYDALNRLTFIDYADDSQDVTFIHDTGINGMGRLTAMSDAVGTESYGYDTRGNLASVTRSISGAGYITGFAYNGADRLIQITYPSGMVVDYTLDAAGRVIAVDKTVASVTEELVTGVAYEPFGPVNSFTFGNGLSMNAVYDRDYELVDLHSGAALDWIFGYDDSGNILSITDQADPVGNQVLTYDDLYRLESAAGVYGGETFDYDANGNRTSYVIDGVDTLYTYEALSNRLATLGDWTFSRDAAGNRTSMLDATGEGYVYQYGDHNRLNKILRRQNGTKGKGKGKQVSVDSDLGIYAYDGYGQRVKKSVTEDDHHFIYGHDGLLLGEYSADATPVNEYVYWNGRLIAVVAWSANSSPATEIVVDNDSPQAQATGSWSLETSNSGYGENYRLARGEGNTYRWTADLAAGAYDVFAWWVSRKNYSSAVDYTITSNGVTEVVTRSHRSGGGRWQLLGTFVFDESGTDFVSVDAANGRTSADAVRFVASPGGNSMTASTYYIHTDHLGTPRQVSDQNRSLVWRWDSSPFGATMPDDDADRNGSPFVLNIRFPGQYYDAESGWHYNYFRDYDPGSGRYVESDPIGLGGGINTYLYAEGNALRYSDPQGLWVKRCARKLGNKNKPAVDPRWNPFRHDYLVVSGDILSFQSGDSMIWSQGRIDKNNENPDNPKCVMVCEDDKFDQYVKLAASQIGAPTYCVWAYTGTQSHSLGARNCQTWADDVLNLARKMYLVNEQCPECF